MAVVRTIFSTFNSFWINWLRLCLLLSFYNVVSATTEDLKASSNDGALVGEPLSGTPNMGYIEVEQSYPSENVMDPNLNQRVQAFLEHLASSFFPSDKHSTYSLYFYVVISSLLVGMTGIIPLLVLPVMTSTENNMAGKNKQLNRLLSFGVGSMLGDVFLHLLPECWSSNYVASHGQEGIHVNNGMFVLLGLISFFVLEKIFLDGDDSNVQEISSTDISSKNSNTNNNSNNQASSTMYHSLPHQNGHGDGHEETNGQAITATREHLPTNIKPSGYLNLLANAIDNFTHGLAVGSSYLISTRVGMITTLAILFHEIPHEVGDFAVLLRAGFSKMHAAKMQVVTATGSVLGALTALNGGDTANWILPFTSGGFIYIALSTVVPDLMEETSLKESFIHLVAMVMAISIMHGISFLD